MTGRALGLCAVLAVLAAGGAARAEVQEGGLVRFPAPRLEALLVKNPQGPLTLRGWDRDEVHIGFRKRAKTAAMLEVMKVDVQMHDGRLQIRSGIEVRGELRALPQPDASIELVIDAPRQAQLFASTFIGDLVASGFRRGVDLDSRAGAIRVHDINGQVSTHAGRGDQWLRSIQGAVRATGVTGDVDLASVEGPSLSAQVVRGQIQARDIRAEVVELQAAIGTLVLMGGLVAGGRYDLHVEEGEVRVLLRDPPSLGLTVEALGRVADNGLRLHMLRVGGLVERPGYLRGELRAVRAPGLTAAPLPAMPMTALHIDAGSGDIRLLAAPQP